MAKGARASSKKANNARLKAGVFGPVEGARNERLSAKLLELASQPKPKKNEVAMEVDSKETRPSTCWFPDLTTSRCCGREQHRPSIRQQASRRYGYIPLSLSIFIELS